MILFSLCLIRPRSLTASWTRFILGSLSWPQALSEELNSCGQHLPQPHRLLPERPDGLPAGHGHTMTSFCKARHRACLVHRHLCSTWHKACPQKLHNWYLLNKYEKTRSTKYNILHLHYPQVNQRKTVMHTTLTSFLSVWFFFFQISEPLTTVRLGVWQVNLGSQPQRFPRWNLKLAPRTRRAGRRKKDAGWWGVILIHKGTYTRLVFHGCQISRPPYLPTRTLQVYTDTHKVQMVPATPYSQGCVLENSPHCGNGGWKVHSGAGEGLWCQGQPGGHVLFLMTSSNSKP